jgi:hypothetical protein
MFCTKPVLATGAELGALLPQLVELPISAPKPALQAASPPPPQATNKAVKLIEKILLK